MTSPKTEEERRLRESLDAVDINIDLTQSRLNRYASEIKETKAYMWEARRDLDHIDKIALRQMIDQKSRSAEVLNDRRRKLAKLRASPYFGRVDFAREDGEARPIYIGVHDFEDERNAETLVYDWRAPISSIFYDYELGPAAYDAPSGRIEGEVALKRQFRIRGGKIELLLETSVNVVDELLQEELGRASDAGMRNIVATIQRDQNAIIRNGDAETLIIQGVAGSGKTSIALHRIAFLLYRFKDDLSSSDILILSPNRVFSEYIGNVLPELGEEQVEQIGMERLADTLLEGKFKFESFFEQAERLLAGRDADLNDRIAAKADPSILREVDRYVAHVEANSFKGEDWKLRRGLIVPAWFLEEAWKKHRGLSAAQRIREVVAAAEHQMGLHYNHDLDTGERQALRAQVKAMADLPGLRAAYKGFFDWLGRPELFRTSAGRLEYADAFLLIYMKMKLEGVENPYAGVKHLLVDEMQDYTPVQYAVLARLFTCRKTVLGDAAQSVVRGAAVSAAQIRDALGGGDAVKLTKSYRSSWDIMQFALQIAPNSELEPIHRRGEAPELVTGLTKAKQVAVIGERLDEFAKSDHRSLAVITRTARRAKELHKRLDVAGHHIQLIDTESADLGAGAVICPVHLAKGLEFDRVIVPDADAKTYCDDLDRNLLYVACTRSMHRLCVIAPGTPSALLPASPASAE